MCCAFVFLSVEHLDIVICVVIVILSPVIGRGLRRFRGVKEDGAIGM